MFFQFGSTFGIGLTELLVFLAITIGIGVWVVRTWPTRWPFGFAICFLVGALFTPADPVSMLLAALPLSVAYGLGVLAGKVLPTNGQAE